MQFQVSLSCLEVDPISLKTNPSLSETFNLKKICKYNAAVQLLATFQVTKFIHMCLNREAFLKSRYASSDFLRNKPRWIKNIPNKFNKYIVGKIWLIFFYNIFLCFILSSLGLSFIIKFSLLSNCTYLLFFCVLLKIIVYCLYTLKNPSSKRSE